MRIFHCNNVKNRKRLRFKLTLIPGPIAFSGVRMKTTSQKSLHFVGVEVAMNGRFPD